MRRMLALLGAILMVGLAGCGDETNEPGSSEPAALTSRAIAAVALDHLPDDTTHRQATYIDEYDPKGLIGAELSYNGDGEYDGDQVRVTVQPGPLGPCDRGDHCTDLGDGVRLTWGEGVPEEDPGAVGLSKQNGDDLVHVSYSGPHITGDPRDLDLPISVDELVAVVSDPRLRLTTDAATVAAGEDLDDWSGGEIDPASLELVPQTDASIVVGWIYAYGDAWRYVGPSPYKELFGRDAVGGRVEVTGDMQIQKSGFLDAIAAPHPPPWLAGGGCLDGYQCGTFQGVQVVWRPAQGDDPGDAFLLHVWPDGETVAIHNEGKPMPDRFADAVWAAGLGLWSFDLTDRQAETKVSLRTTRAKRDQAERLARKQD